MKKEEQKRLYADLYNKARSELEDLKSRVKRCNFGSDTGYVFGYGFPLADIVFIKEKPDKSEFIKGEAFSSEDRERIGLALKKLSYNPDYAYFTNVNKCEVCKNKNDTFKKCLDLLIYELLIIKPKLVVCFGKIPKKAVREIWGLGDIKESFISTPYADIIFSVDFKGIFKDSQGKKRLWEDLKNIKKCRLRGS